MSHQNPEKPNIQSKMLTTRSDLPQESLQIKQDDQFFNKLLSKECSMANTSARVYYGIAPAAIPFMWESQPGTPKHTTSTTSIPPLTPPPSYLYTSKKMISNKYSKSNLLNTLFPQLTSRKPHVSPSSSSSSYSASSSSSPSKSSKSHRRNQLASPGSSFSSMGEIDDPGIGSPTSTLRYGMTRRSNSMVTMKTALLSILGCGSSHGNA